MDDFDRALLKINLEKEPAERHRKDLLQRSTFLLGELRASRRLLEHYEFSDLALLDEDPEVFLLDLEHWLPAKMAELLSIIPTLRQVLIDLDQAGVFRERLALEGAMSEMWAASNYADNDWLYDRAAYPDHPWKEEEE